MNIPFLNKNSLAQEQHATKIDKNLEFKGNVETPNANRTVSLNTIFDNATVLDVTAYKLLMEDE